MKFRNKETGEVFDKIIEAKYEYCEKLNHKCGKCKLMQSNNALLLCQVYCELNPKEAAEIMGYEVIEDEPTETIKNDIPKGDYCKGCKHLQYQQVKVPDFSNGMAEMRDVYSCSLYECYLMSTYNPKNGVACKCIACRTKQPLKELFSEPDQTTKDQAITLDELLRQTAEEATELAQAALKLLRALKGETPVTKEQALKNLTEEAADVKNCLMLLENNQIIRQGAVFEVQARKMERWKERVKERNGNNERT